jgi:hypothetical protein
MSFTSHTFTSLPLVHTPNPDFLRRHLWLCFLLVHESPHSGIFVRRDFWTWPLADSRILQTPDSWFHRFMTSGLYEFATSKLRRFEIPGLRTFANSELRRLEIPDLRMSATSELRRFEIPNLRMPATSELRRFEILDLRTSDVPESSFHEFHKPRCFEGDRFSWIPQHAIEGEM